MKYSKELLIVTCLAFFGICLSVASAKRIAPKKVPPVTHEGIEYHAPLDVANIGRIQARDPESKKGLWEKVIYQIAYNEDLERDVQWIFIADLEIRKGNLIITDEHKRRYSLNLKTNEVRREGKEEQEEVKD